MFRYIRCRQKVSCTWGKKREKLRTRGEGRKPPEAEEGRSEDNWEDGCEGDSRSGSRPPDPFDGGRGEGHDPDPDPLRRNFNQSCTPSLTYPGDQDETRVGNSKSFGVPDPVRGLQEGGLGWGLVCYGAPYVYEAPRGWLYTSGCACTCLGS